MKAQILKILNDKAPEILKRTTFPLIRGRLINNKMFLEQFEVLNEFDRLNDEQQNEIQLGKLKQMLIYAYENVPYYNNIFDTIKFDPYNFNDLKEMEKIPILTKEEVVRNQEKLFSKKNIDYYITNTGGTTGKSLDIVLDKDSIYMEKAFIYHYWSCIGYNYLDTKIVTFRGLEFNNAIYKYNPIYNEIILSPFKLSQETIKKYIKIIDKFGPEFLHGYPSAIYSFCKLLKKNKLTLKNKVKGVFFISENVDEFEKEFIEHTLDCKCLAFYGHSERAVFAEELNGSYNFNKLYSYTELIKENDDYKIICTGFLNSKMPLIRYLTDDYVVIKNNCTKITGHRNKEVLIGINDERISLAAVNFHSNEFEKIKSYQFEQSEKGKAVIKIVAEEEVTDDDINLMRNVINKKLLNVLNLEIKIVTEIPLTNRGKYRKIIQNLRTV